ncbi:MAP3K12-binding inhibitory protein 1 [Willisornis vidua]|uniref:MAP3K12-binding inhibitory protein 1 n=1 Tax=Willisornis vidua TaxID=1566151 RepID=A0ABQ9D920_9PASS|nr:MAP3K12-binding inhibitory protein 1 [Willisornis vidua]
MAAAATAEPSPAPPGGRAPDTDPAASEVASSALRCLAGLAGQLNLGGDIVKVVIDWSKLQSTSALQPALLFSALQQHILCLQPLLEKLQSLIKEENTGHVEPAGKTESQTCETSLDIYDGNCQTEEKYASYDLGDLKDAHIHFDPEVVQIKAGKAEIERRISAFIERKQAEINENNVREFCNVIDCNQVSRVVNTYGPQTRSEGALGSSHKANIPMHDCGNQAVEERLQNIEAHLRLQTGCFERRVSRSSVKQMFELLEIAASVLDNLLAEKERKRQKGNQCYEMSLLSVCTRYALLVYEETKAEMAGLAKQNYSLAELDEKINAIKQALLRKTKENKSKEAEQLLQ